MLKGIIRKLKKAGGHITRTDADPGLTYEFCPNCEANLTLQKGYNSSLPYWKCKGCGETLINPEVDTKDDIVWICDGCGSMLNIQSGFDELCGEWQCTVCGLINKISEREIYYSDDEYQASLCDPYRGLSDDSILALSLYEDIGYLAGRRDIILVEERETGKRYVKKLLKIYDRSIYEFLLHHTIMHMPKVENLYESSNRLIVIEEYIEGKTVAELLDKGPLSEEESLRIVLDVCAILKEIHSLPIPVIHRDIKPSNIIVTSENDVCLLDVNVAKWYDPEEKADATRHLGTENFAAPEQLGYGLTALSPKADIYAVGILLNLMLTGHYPKDQKAEGRLWGVIKKCISLETEDRYTAEELIVQLNSYNNLKGDINGTEEHG